MSICTALALCLTLLPTAAWASGGDTAGSAGGDAGDSGGSGDIDDTDDSGPLTISGDNPLTIDLNGHTLDTDGTAITVSEDATLTIENDPEEPESDTEPEPGTITGGGIHVEAGGTLTIQNKVEITGNNLMENGGGIYAAGTVTLQGDVKITNNTATNGGGIYIAGGDVTIQGNVEITGNTATGAGDTGLGGGVYNAGAFTMNGGAIHGNSAQKRRR